MNEFITLVFNGLSLSSIILLTSLGLAITFGLMKVINMAHGEFLMIGAYITYVVQNIFLHYIPDSIKDWYYFAAILAAFGVSFCFGCLLERIVISRLYGREIDSLLATWGVSLIFQQGARTVFGTQGVNVSSPSWLTGGLTIGGCTFSYNRMFIILLVLFCLGLVWFVMNRTNFGRQMTAVMQNRSMAQCMGINSKMIDCVSFGIGSALAGVAGCSLALLGSIDSTVGQNYIVQCFITVVLGGVGNLLGAVIGSVIVGFSTIFVQHFTSSMIANAVVMLIIIIFLQKRPQGLFVIRSRQLDE